MNPGQLLDHFDRISEAPDAVPRLRSFILDLAVRGKLVEQDRMDEPASELLARIRVEKARILRAGNIRREKALPPLVEDQLPFRVPRSWRWSQLGEIGFLNPRNRAADDLPASFVPMPSISAEYGVACRHEVRPWGEIKSGYTHFAEGDVALAKITPCFENGKSAVFRGLSGGLGAGTTELHIVRPVFVIADYALIFLKSPHFIESGLPRMTGTAGQKRVPTEYFAHSPFPLPPFAEQHRIVAKVNELMALCDRLAAARVERERRRDRLAAASLHRLNQPADAGKSPTFREHARFHISHLSCFTTRPDQIAALRQTILGLAVRGRLVPHDSTDEPASALLKRIHAEKTQLLMNGQIKRLKSAPAVVDSRLTIDWPQGWELQSLQSLCISISDGDHQPPPKTDRGVPFLVIGNVRWRSIDFNGCRHVSNEYYRALDSVRRPQKGDILYTLVGSFGIPVMVSDDRPFCIQRHIGILRPSTNVDIGFLACVLGSRFVFDQASACATGIAQKTVPLAGLRALQIPLPPLLEQARIASKVNELMAVCDQLEAQLTGAQARNRRLLEAVLHEAFDSAA